MKQLLIASLITISGLFLHGCGGCLMLGSSTKTFNGHDSMVLKQTREDILDIIASAGKSMGYEVSSIDKEHNSIGLSNQTSMATTHLIGKIAHSTIRFSIKNQKNININIVLVGNFEHANQENANKIIQEFKTKISEQLGEVQSTNPNQTKNIDNSCLGPRIN